MKKIIASTIVVILGGALLAGCAERSASPTPPEPQGEQERKTPQKAKPVATAEKEKPLPAVELDEDERSGLVDLEKARELLVAKKFEDLLEIFEPGQVPSLTAPERSLLADMFYAAARSLRERRKDVSFSSLFCERGLMLDGNHQPLLRLQVRNYLHPEMKLFGGAEELCERLVKIDPRDQRNQFLRGKTAFDQGEWDVAVDWLKKAARVGRTEKSSLTRKAWHLLDLAKGHVQELKAALSMTRELEIMLKRAKIKSRDLAMKQVATDKQPATRKLAGGDIILYMTSWCGYCRKTRTLLKQLNVPFKQKDIEKDKQALMEMMRFAQSAGVEVTGVPVIKIGNQLVVGFNEKRITDLVQRVR